MSAYSSVDLDRKAVVRVQNNLMRCTDANSGVVAVNNPDANARFDVQFSDNYIQASSGGGLAVYLYDWPVLSDEPKIDLTGNWWGTADAETIAGLVYDGGEDFNLPTIQTAPAASVPDPVGSTLSYPAMADAGPDISASADLDVTLDGSGTYDPDDLAVYAWTQTGGTPVALKDADSAVAVFVTPLGGEAGENTDVSADGHGGRRRRRHGRGGGDGCGGRGLAHGGTG